MTDAKRRSAQLVIRVREHERRDYELCADAAGMPLSEWIRNALNTRARKERPRAKGKAGS